MTADPKRLIETESDTFGSRLLRAGRHNEPSRAARERALAVAGFAATSAISGTATGAGGLVAALKWAAIGVSSASIIGLGTVAAMRHSERLEFQAAARSDHAAHVRARSAPAPTAEPESVAPVTSTPAPAPAASGSGSEPALAPAHREHVRSETYAPHRAPNRAVPRPATSASAAASESTLAEELAAMDEARRAVAAHSAAGALAALEAYDARYPHARFGQEALVLRIEALAQSGQLASAQSMARRFLAAYPRSPAARKVRALVGLPSEQPKTR